MKNILQKWRGLTAGAMLVATTLTAADGPAVKTLGGGPNQTSNARAGSADGETLEFAKFKKPYAAALDSNGDLLIADFGNGRIRKVTRPGAADSLTSTLISGLKSPTGIAIGASNVIYVVTQGDGRLRKFSSSGELLETVSGFRSPTAVTLPRSVLTFGTNGTVYVAELGGNIYQIRPNEVPMLVGSGFRRPHGIAALENGLIAVTESSGHAVQLLDPATGVSTLLAGGNGAGFADGSVARFNQPYGIALAPSGSLVVSDKANHRVRVVGTNGVVSTLYGVSKSSWFAPFPGWVDGAGGANGVAASRDPVGVAVDANGVVYTTEIYWNLLRQVTGAALGSANGVATNEVIIGTNVVTIVGTNVISLGFASGEASSAYVGAAGQTFYVPTTITLALGQPIYSFQMSLSVTGETGVVMDPSTSRFGSMLLKPNPSDPTENTVINHNYQFLNSSLNLLGVAWFERIGETNLYPANAQDLISMSQAKNTLFEKDGGKVILGAYAFVIPSVATPADTFLVAMRNPSGSADGVSQPVPLRVPTDGGLGAGTLNTIKRITLASKPYLVGDSVPFRWFNAGDFGDFNLVNTDLADLFQTVEYDLNRPPTDSDLFDALDSSGGATNIFFGDDITINNITTGDGVLNVDDLWVTFRRSLDPSLKWFARYWSNGVRQSVEVPNTLIGGFQTVAAGSGKSKGSLLVGPRPQATLASGDAAGSPGATLEIPVQLSLSAGYSARVLMLSVTVEALDGSPALTVPIQFQTSPALQAPEFSNSRGGNHYAAAWLNHAVPGLAGDSILAFLTFKVPSNAGSRAAYRVTFNHFSASPNGVALFDARTTSGLVLLSDRSASTWNDGIADAWRLRYFGSIYAQDSAVSADADGDGVINSIEYQNGTNPTDATSF